MATELNQKLDDIRALHAIIQANGKNVTKTTAVLFKFHKEVDHLIDRLEDLYYKIYMKNRSTASLETAMEKDIVAAQMMKRVLPYAIALSMVADADLLVST